MKKLTCLIDTNRELLRDLRQSFAETNKVMAEYEQDIANKEIKGKARRARLELKKAMKKYNETMNKLAVIK